MMERPWEEEFEEEEVELGMIIRLLRDSLANEKFVSLKLMSSSSFVSTLIKLACD